MSILAVDGVSISFGGVHALDRVSTTFNIGEIVGIIGPNGAGKTTLLNVICGLNRPDAGEVRLEDRPITGMKPNQIAGMGLARTFQTSQLFAGMSILENMMTGLHLRSRRQSVLCRPPYQAHASRGGGAGCACPRCAGFRGLRRNSPTGPAARSLSASGES